MTADRTLVCRRCGFANVPGDQFCGSCGAFLEWEGEPATPSGAGETRDPDVPVIGPMSPAPILPPGSRPGSRPGSGPATGTTDAGLVRCPVCGIANAATRTFCQSCGSRLADAGKVGAASKEQIAAAVSAPVVLSPAPVLPGRVRPSGPSSGGVVKWVVLMGLLGLAVGIGIVLVGGVLRGNGPSSAASAGPSTASGAVADSPGASGQVAASGDAASSAEASAPPSQAAAPVALVMTGAIASSVVGDVPKFQPEKAIDGDPATCWQEGSRTEKGEWIEVSFDPATVSSVVLTNGYNASRALYRGNHRLKDILISVAGGAPVKARLKDTGDPQRIKLKAVPGATTLRISIVSVYPSVKTSVAGTPFDDTALGEIAVFGVPES